MAAENTLTIRFKAEGQDELKAAFKSLAKATKEVTASQQKLQSTTKKTTKYVAFPKLVYTYTQQ